MLGELVKCWCNGGEIWKKCCVMAFFLEVTSHSLWGLEMGSQRSLKWSLSICHTSFSKLYKMLSVLLNFVALRCFPPHFLARKYL